MGWTYNTRPQSKAAYVDELLREYTSPSTLLKHSLRGSRLWVLIRRGDRAPEIGLLLLHSMGGYWGHKGMGEADGPFYYDCPLSFLNAAPEPDCLASRNHLDSGRGWRSFVQEHHAQASQRRRSRPAVGPGSWVTVPEAKFPGYGGRYLVTQDLGRKGLELNNCLRIKAQQVKHLEVAATP